MTSTFPLFLKRFPTMFFLVILLSIATTTCFAEPRSTCPEMTQLQPVLTSTEIALPDHTLVNAGDQAWYTITIEDTGKYDWSVYSNAEAYIYANLYGPFADKDTAVADCAEDDNLGMNSAYIDSSISGADGAEVVSVYAAPGDVYVLQVVLYAGTLTVDEVTYSSTFQTPVAHLVCELMAPLDPVLTSTEVALPDHTLVNAGDQAWYTITVEDTGKYDWSIYFNAEAYIDIYLYGPFADTATAVTDCADDNLGMNSAYIDSSTSFDGSPEVVSVYAESGDVYVLQVELYAGTLTVDEVTYSSTFQTPVAHLVCHLMAPLDPVLTSTAIALPDHTLVNAGDQAWYTITIEEAGTYDWSVYFNAEADIDTYLYGPFADISAAVADCADDVSMTMSSIDSSTSGDANLEMVSVYAASEGVYVLQVELYAGTLTVDEVTYSSSFQIPVAHLVCNLMAPLDPVLTSTEIALPDHTLVNAGDQAWYTITVEDSGKYDWSIYFNAEAYIDIYLYGPFADKDAAVADCTDDNSGMNANHIGSYTYIGTNAEMVSVYAASGDVYVLQVNLFGGLLAVDGVTYSSTFQTPVAHLVCELMAPLDPVLTSTQIALPDHTLVTAGDQAWYTITIEDTGKYEWSIHSNAEADIYANLYGPFADNDAAVADCADDDLGMNSAHIDSSTSFDGSPAVVSVHAESGDVYVLQVELFGGLLAVDEVTYSSTFQTPVAHLVCELMAPLDPVLTSTEIALPDHTLVNAGDQAWYTITVEDSGKYVWSIYFNAEADIDTYLYGPFADKDTAVADCADDNLGMNSAHIDSSAFDVDSAEVVSVYAESGDVYVLQVNLFGGLLAVDDVTYSSTFQTPVAHLVCELMAPLDPVLTSTEIALPDHTLVNAGDQAWYTITVEDSGKYDWSVYFNAEADIDTYLYGPFADKDTAVADCAEDDNLGMNSAYIDSSTLLDGSPEVVSAFVEAGKLYVLQVKLYGGTLNSLSYRSSVFSSMMPSNVPSNVPSSSSFIDVPSDLPSNMPSKVPSNMPSNVPSNMPSQMPSSSVLFNMPSNVPSDTPTAVSGNIPTIVYTKVETERTKAPKAPKARKKTLRKKIPKKARKASV